MSQDEMQENAVTSEEANGTPESAAVDEGGETAFVVESKKPLNRTTLVMFAFLLVGAGGIYGMRMRAGPQPAAAANIESAKADATISQFLSDGGKSLKTMQEMLRNTEKVVQKFANFPSAAQVPTDKLQTDPFQFQPDKRGEDPEAMKDRLKKEEKERQEKERKEVLAAVQKLHLQSIIHSDATKACMMNNSMVREGQQVDSFTIEKINPNGIIVRKGVYLFELKMEK